MATTKPQRIPLKQGTVVGDVALGRLELLGWSHPIELADGGQPMGSDPVGIDVSELHGRLTSGFHVPGRADPCTT